MMATMGNLAEIYERISVSDLFPDAKKSGAGYKMLCPFHSEKTPSFVIYADEKRFHCFGCGNHGDYADYVQERGWAADFKDAVNYLRKKAGMEECGCSQANNRLYEVNRMAADYFHSVLLGHKPALDYLFGRGITMDSIKKYLLGFSGERYSAALRKKGITLEEMKRAGLVIKEEMFRSRIMFPIMRSGKVLSFAGRVMDDSKPKYINTINTPVFHKGSALYGLQPKSIKTFGFGISVEGYLDVIAFDQIGFDNAFAPMGTALTEKQVMEVKRHTHSLVVMNDGDDAGINGSDKAIGGHLLDSLLNGEMTVRVAQLPAGEDPHSYITSKGEDAMIGIIDAAVIAEVFLVRRHRKERLSLITRIASSQKDVAADLLPYLTEMERVLVRELSAKRVLEMLRTTGKLLLRNKNVEVRQWDGLLLVYQNHHYLLWQKANDDPRKQAYAIARQVLTTTKMKAKPQM